MPGLWLDSEESAQKLLALSALPLPAQGATRGPSSFADCAESHVTLGPRQALALFRIQFSHL